MIAANCQNELGYQIEMPSEIPLALTVRDPETVLELWRRQEGEPRDNFALSALRLGVLALRQAAGAIDTATVRQEGERLVSSLRALLAEQANQTTRGLAEALKHYFDPTDGQLPQRLERLLKRDGELETILARQVGDNGSTLARTLAQHVGESSPLLKMLSPDQADGLLGALTETIQNALNQQRTQVLAQFSLDQDDSALSRLLKQITDANGAFRRDLAQDISRLCGEFSLDNEDGALTRLVRQVDRAQKSIVEQFSNDNENSALRRMTKLLETTNTSIQKSLTLDDESSPLSRLRRELMNVLEDEKKANGVFHTEVRAVLDSMKVRREEADRSTLHGGEFQDAVGSVLQIESQRLGDAVAPLIAQAREVRFIDPYFAADADQLKILHRCFSLCGAIARCELCSIQLHVDGQKIQPGAEQHILGEIRKKWPVSLPPVAIVRWKHDYLHNRFILTDKGGIMLGDTLRFHASRPDQLTLMEEEVRRRWWLNFDPECQKEHRLEANVAG